MRGVWVFHAFGLVILSGLGGMTPARALDDRRNPGTPTESSMQRAYRRASEVETETQRNPSQGNQRTVRRKAKSAIPDNPNLRLEVGAAFIFLDSLRAGRNASNGTSSTRAVRPLLSLNGARLISEDWWVGALIALQPLQIKSEDGFSTSRTTVVQTYLGTNWGGWDFRGGMGVLNYSVSGEGGTTTQANVDWTTVFALPDTSSTSRLFLLTLGTGKRAEIGSRIWTLRSVIRFPVSDLLTSFSL